MLVKSLSDDLAWTVQRELVNKYFRVKNEENTFDMSELSPELQMFNKMLQAVAKSELEQKKLKQQLNEVNYQALEAKEEASKSREEIRIKKALERAKSYLSELEFFKYSSNKYSISFAMERLFCSARFFTTSNKSASIRNVNLFCSDIQQPPSVLI